MSKVLQEREFGRLPSSTETNLRDQVKSISTTIEADSNLIRRIGSTQYVVSTGQNRTLFYKPRQTTIPFPDRLEDHYCEEDGNYGPKFTEAYGASLINNTIVGTRLTLHMPNHTDRIKKIRKRGDGVERERRERDERKKMYL
ncbi:hypothetical protein Tco_0392712 [Tanacetum coccineum]